MLINAKYLKGTKDRKWCPAALFSFLFKMISLLCPLYFQFKFWSPSMVWKEEREKSYIQVKRKQCKQTTSSVLDHGLWSKLRSFHSVSRTYYLCYLGKVNLTSFILSTIWTMILPHMVVKFKKIAHLRFLAQFLAQCMCPKMFALMM